MYALRSVIGPQQGFKRRAAAVGLDLKIREGHSKAVVRSMALTAENLKRYTDDVMKPLLLEAKAACHARGLQLTLSEVVNFDEFYLDLNTFACGGR